MAPEVVAPGGGAGRTTAPDPRLVGAPVGAQIAWNVPDAVAVLDEEARILWANLAAERLTGRSVSSWVGRSGLDLVHPDDVELAALSLGTVRGKEVGTPIEIRVATPTGWRLVELIGVPTQIDGRDATVMSLRDLTDRRRWEIANDADAAFRSLVQHSTTLSVLVDADLRVRSSSAALTRLLGHDQELAEGRPITLLVADPDQHRLCAAFERAAGSSSNSPELVEVAFRHGTEERLIP